MLRGFLLVGLLSFALGLQKTVIISSMQITAGNTIPFDNPNIEFSCTYGSGGTTGEAQVLSNVIDKNIFYIIEKQYFIWNNETSGNKASCQVTNKGLVSDTDFGTR